MSYTRQLKKRNRLSLPSGNRSRIHNASKRTPHRITTAMNGLRTMAISQVIAADYHIPCGPPRVTAGMPYAVQRIWNLV